MKKYFSPVVVLIALVSAGLAFIGVLYVDRFEEEGYMEFFIKAKPSLLIFSFADPYATDLYGYDNSHTYKIRQDAEGNWLPGTKEFTEFSRYCFYRYGVSEVSQTSKRQECRSMSEQGRNVRWPYSPGRILILEIITGEDWKLPWA